MTLGNIAYHLEVGPLMFFQVPCPLMACSSVCVTGHNRKARVETEQKEAARTQWLEEDTALMAVLGTLISVLGAAGNL